MRDPDSADAGTLPEALSHIMIQLYLVLIYPHLGARHHEVEAAGGHLAGAGVDHPQALAQQRNAHAGDSLLEGDVCKSKCVDSVW